MLKQPELDSLFFQKPYAGATPALAFVNLYEEKCNQLRIEPNKTIIQLFTRAEKKGYKISNLDLSHKKMDSRALLPIAASMATNFTIQILNLAGNNIERRYSLPLCTVAGFNAR